MALVGQVVRKYGGKIEIGSSTLGGASFTVRIPEEPVPIPEEPQ
ncbi:MAG: hypothetical protein GEU86_19145 [Actinophytocola sp.]|nr:hypothetical protein [Actinophytocola sp.]